MVFLNKWYNFFTENDILFIEIIIRIWDITIVFVRKEEKLFTETKTLFPMTKLSFSSLQK